MGLLFYQAYGQTQRLLDIVAMLKAEIADLRRSLSAQGIHDLLDQVARLVQANSQSEYQIGALRQWVLELFRDNAQSTSRADVAQQQLQHVQTEKSEIEATLQTLDQQHKQLCATEKTQREGLEKQLREARDIKEPSVQQLEELRRALTDARQDHDRDVSAHQLMQEQLHELRTAKDHDADLLARSEGRVEQLAKDVQSALAKVETLKAEYDALRQEMTEVEAQKGNLQGTLQRRERALETAHQDSQELEVQLSDQRVETERLEGLYNQARRTVVLQEKAVSRNEEFKRKRNAELEVLATDNEKLQEQLGKSEEAADARVQESLDAARGERDMALREAEAARERLEKNEKEVPEQIVRLHAEKKAADEGLRASQEQVSRLEAAQRAAEEGSAGLALQVAGLHKLMADHHDNLVAENKVAKKVRQDLEQQVQQFNKQLQEQKEGREKDKKHFDEDYATLMEQVSGYDKSIEEAQGLSRVSEERERTLSSEKETLRGQKEALTQQMTQLQVSQGQANEQHDALRRANSELQARMNTQHGLLLQAGQRVRSMEKAMERDKATIQDLVRQAGEHSTRAAADKEERARLESKIAAMDAEGVQLQEQLSFYQQMHEPLEFNDPSFSDPFASLALDADEDWSVTDAQRAQMEAIFGEEMGAAEQYPAGSVEERLQTALSGEEQTSAAPQLPSGEAGQESGSGETQPMGLGAGQGDASAAAQAPQSAQVPSSIDTWIPDEVDWSLWIEPSDLGNDQGDSSAPGNPETPSQDYHEAWQRSLEGQGPPPGFDFVGPAIPRTGAAVADPSTWTIFDAESSATGSQPKPDLSSTESQPQPSEGPSGVPQANFLFSSRDATSHARLIAKPVTQNRALRQRQKDWAAGKHPEAPGASSSKDAPKEDTPSVPSDPKTKGGAPEQAGAAVEDILTPPTHVPSDPPARRDEGPAFEEPDLSELDRVFNDPTFDVLTGVAHSPEVKPEHFSGVEDPEIQGSMRLDEE